MQLAHLFVQIKNIHGENLTFFAVYINVYFCLSSKYLHKADFCRLDDENSKKETVDLYSISKSKFCHVSVLKIAISGSETR